MKLAKLALLLLFITFCTEDNNLSIENNADEALENESNNQEDLVDWDSALGKSPEIFVSTWNSVVNSISNDEETILFFSIDPDEVKWTSSDKDQLVYKWGDASKQDNIFILNLNIENEIVRTVQFFAPTTNVPLATNIFHLMTHSCTHPVPVIPLLSKSISAPPSVSSLPVLLNLSCLDFLITL